MHFYCMPSSDIIILTLMDKNVKVNEISKDSFHLKSIKNKGATGNFNINSFYYLTISVHQTFPVNS